jgi:Tol biopolymer transport system component
VYRLPVLAPDDRRVSLGVPPATGLPDVWTVDTQRGVTTRLTFGNALEEMAVWSPDSARIVFGSGRDGGVLLPNSLYVKAANGTGVDERLFVAANNEILAPFDWSSDGRFLLFARMNNATWREKVDLWVLEMTGERTASALIESPFRKGSAKFSPDGRWIAYASNESNGFQIFVQPFPDVGRGKWQISARGGQEPRWRADGRELFFLDPDGVLMAIDVQAEGEAFEYGQPQALFRTGVTLPRIDETPDYFYNVTSDGERFLVNEPVAVEPNAPAAADAEPVTLTVIVNWASGLAQ